MTSNIQQTTPDMGGAARGSLLNKYFERTLADYSFKYRDIDCVAVYVRTRLDHSDHQIPCTVIERDLMLTYLLSGGTAAFWQHPSWGPTAKYRIASSEHSVALSRWVMDCQTGYRVQFDQSSGLPGKWSKLDLTRPNLFLVPDRASTIAPARQTLARSFSQRGLAQGRTLGDRLVLPERLIDISRPFTALA